MSLIQIISIMGSFSIFLAVIELIRRNKLKERYSLLWLASSLILLLFSVWRDLLDKVSHYIGIYYPPAFLFLLAFIFMMLILMHFSVIISSLSEKNKQLAQEIGILKMKLESKKEENPENPG